MDSRIMDVLKDRVLELGPEPATGPYKNFKLTRDDDGIAWLLFDREGTSANTLSEDVLVEFETVIAALEQDRPAGIVIRSAKPSGFIAGADVNEFRGVSDPREGMLACTGKGAGKFPGGRGISRRIRPNRDVPGKTRPSQGAQRKAWNGLPRRARKRRRAGSCSQRQRRRDAGRAGSSKARLCTRICS